HRRGMDGAAAAAAHVGVRLARQGFGNLDPEGDEGLRHLLAGAASGCEQALEPSRDARGINSGAPTRHAVEPHADRAACLAPRDLCHAPLLPGELAHEIFVFRRIAQEHEAAGAAFEDLPGRRGIVRRAKRLAAALRAGSNHTFHGRHPLPAFPAAHSVSVHAPRSAGMAHYAKAASFTAARILRVASSRSSAAMTASLDSWSSALPRATLGPSRRTTSGTPIFTSLTAAMMPSAIMSQRMMPPKIFTS